MFWIIFFIKRLHTNLSLGSHESFAMPVKNTMSFSSIRACALTTAKVPSSERQNVAQDMLKLFDTMPSCALGWKLNMPGVCEMS